MNKLLLNLPTGISAYRLPLTLLAAVCAFAISGCDNPKPTERNATVFDLVTTDDANEARR